jgi:hypothetical protein
MLLTFKEWRGNINSVGEAFDAWRACEESFTAEITRLREVVATVYGKGQREMRDRAADTADGQQREKKWFNLEVMRPSAQIYNEAVCEVADLIRALPIDPEPEAMHVSEREGT